jgi:aminopeptidase N
VANGQELEVIQEGAVPRPHRVGIGWYRRDGRPSARVEADLAAALHSGRIPVPAGAGPDDVVLVNDGDLTYAKARLVDWDLLCDLLPGVADPLNRAVLWGAAWEAVRDALLPVEVFLDLLARGLPGERTVSVFEDLLANAWDAAVPLYLPAAARPAATRRLVADCAAIAARGDTRRLSAVRGWAAGTDDVAALRRRLAGEGLPRGVLADADLRWRLLRRLSVLGDASEAEIDEEYGRDRAAGAEHAAWCRAARPDPRAKARAWDELTSGGTLSNTLLFATAEGFWRPEQQAVTESYVDRYALDFPLMARRRPAPVAGRLARLGYPRFAVAPETLDMSERMLARDDLTVAVRRAVVDAIHDLRRSLAAQALARAGAPGGAR